MTFLNSFLNKFKSKKFNVAVFGSCVSRDVFQSQINPEYKKYFNILFDNQRVSLISLMQDSVTFNDELIKIEPETKKNLNRSNFIREDLNKEFLQKIIDEDIDYLIIDNYFDVTMGILCFDNHIITNNDWDLPDTEFYKNISDKKTLNIINDTDKYFELWKENCNKFFDFVYKNSPNTKIILNKARAVNKVLNDNGEIYIKEDFPEMKNNINLFWEKLDSYVYMNFDVDTIEFDDSKFFANESHIWGLASIHYTYNFYSYFLDELKKISK